MYVLNQIFVPTIPTETCNRNDWYSGQITSNMFCAGYAHGGQDSCQVSYADIIGMFISWSW